MKHIKLFEDFISEESITASGSILKKGFYFSSLSKGHEIRNKKTGKTYVVQSVGSDSAEIKDKNSSKFIGFTIMSLKDYEPVDSGLYEYSSEASRPKVGDELIMTKNGKKGKVIKCGNDQCDVDFGNGDVYGIVYRRIIGNKIYEEFTGKPDNFLNESF
jgi:hypothetical protein